ncbi:MAG: tetratricopeptide repeat-containing glycosyltransferase family protein [Alphaproteobacteria bacterium]
MTETEGAVTTVAEIVAYALARAQAGETDEALSLLHEALASVPANAALHSALGDIHRDLGAMDEAFRYYERALILDPDDISIRLNYASGLKARGEYIRAANMQIVLAEAVPDYLPAHVNLGNTWVDLGRLDEAVACFERAIALEPEHPKANFHKGLCLLQQGRLAEGWPFYEWRWHPDISSFLPRPFPVPAWSGDDLRGRTILLHAEQGLGDTLQFVRFVATVLRRGAARVLVEVQPEVRGLLAQSLDGERVAVIDRGPDFPYVESLPPYDVHCPLLSLPLALGIDLGAIPADVPYLGAEPRLVETYTHPIAAAAATVGEGRPLKVGLVWAGGGAHDRDHLRSLCLADLAPLALVRDVLFVSLQKGPAADQASAPPSGMALLTLDIDDFADTAAIVAALDLVITVDTSVAHLAGAMARPVWVLLPLRPDWRWLENREDNPWYPTARLFRQRHRDDWTDVVARVARQLEHVTASPRT